MQLGNTALHFASANGHLRCVTALLEEDVEKDTPNNDGHTPLHAAALNGRLAVARALIAAGAKDNLVGKARVSVRRGPTSRTMRCDTCYRSRGSCVERRVAVVLILWVTRELNVTPSSGRQDAIRSGQD
jgi:ankyrin repeat protein